MKAKVGLEVHVYVRAASKLFCACSAAFLEAAPMTNLCPVCTAQPGAKPMAPNGAAFDAAIRLARAADMRLVPGVSFLRKHYFYPDSPANFQRTSEPVATGGAINGIGLTEVHVEEDPGALDPDAKLVDDNRAGVSLLELVTEPEMDGPEAARAFLRELRFILDALDIADKAAGVKADCNVSLIHDDGHNGPRVELKTVSGFRNVERAVEAEVARQIAATRDGETIVMETRGFDDTTGRSVRTRSKETAADYRFLLEPDVRPIDVAAIAAALPPEESPVARRARLAESTGAPIEEVAPLIEEGLADTLESLVARGIAPADAHRFLLRDVRGDLEVRSLRFADASLDDARIGALLEARAAGRLTPHQVTTLLRIALDGGAFDARMAEELGAKSDDLDADALAVVTEHAKAAADYRGGKAPALNFLVGALMKRVRGRADIETARAAVLRALAIDSPQ